MPLSLFALALAVLVAAQVAYPLWQALGTGGVVYYTNGNDETAYLQYDYARLASSPTRPGQYPVVALHELGLSGGWQNVLYDVGVPLAFTLGTLWLLRRLGWEPARARLAALAFLVLPLLFGGSNPLLRAISYRLDAWHLITWILMVVQPTVALMRSPEPQSSWLALLAVLALGWRLRTAWPVVAAAPILYSFVGLPAAFVAANWELHRRWPWRAGSWWGPPLVAWAGLGTASGLYFAFGVGERLRLFLTPTHLPLFSVSAVLALGCWLAVRPAIEERWRFPAFALALAPAAVANQQLLSGYIAQPSNFEDFFGVFAIAAVLVLGAGRFPRLYPALVLAGCGLWLVTAAATFRTNTAVNGLVPFDAALARALHEDPRHLVINDRDLSSALALTYPRQGITALDYYQGGAAVAARYLPDYRCIRRRVKADYPQDLRFFRTFLLIDSLYAYGGQDYIGAHLGRKAHFVPLFDVNGGCDPGHDRPLRYFVTRQPLR